MYGVATHSWNFIVSTSCEINEQGWFGYWRSYTISILECLFRGFNYGILYRTRCGFLLSILTSYKVIILFWITAVTHHFNRSQSVLLLIWRWLIAWPRCKSCWWFLSASLRTSKHILSCTSAGRIFTIIQILKKICLASFWHAPNVFHRLSRWPAKLSSPTLFNI